MVRAGIFSNLLLILFSINLSAQTICETIATYGNGSSCQVGTWEHEDTWFCGNGSSAPPIGNWTGHKIIISHPIRICNNNIIDLSESNLDTILIGPGASIEFRANSKLIIPENATIIMDENATVFSTNSNSIGTLMSFGEIGVWGRACCCNDPIPGPISVTRSTELCSNTVLPIELANFSVKEKAGNCLVEWTTYSELNNDFFSIDFSTNMLDWTTIHQEPSKGNSTSIQEYQFVDTRPMSNQVSYYRLTQYDYDGNSESFKTVSIKRAQPQEKLKYFPTIVSNQLTITGKFTNQVEIFIYDMYGNLFDEKIIQKTENEILLSFEYFKNGTYFVAINQMEKSEILKVVKTNK